MFAKSVIVCLSLVLLVTCSRAGTECKPQDNPCLCKAADGTAIDISKAFAYPLTIPDNIEKKYHFLFSPCNPIDCETGGTDNTNALCQINGEKDEPVSCGKTATATYDISNASYFSVKFEGGTKFSEGGVDKTRAALITISYSDNDAAFIFVEEDKTTDTKKHIYTFIANVKRSAGGGGAAGAAVGIAGIVIIVLLLVGFIAYFVIGAIVMYTVKGARGSEVIPNITFWKSLPFLIKDGFVFAISPCTTKCGKEGGYTSL